VYPATVSIRRTGPNSAVSPTLPRTDSASFALEAAVGNVDVYEYAVPAVNAPKAYPHRTPGRPARLAVATATTLEARRSP
jgi:hypothetical protein